MIDQTKRWRAQIATYLAFFAAGFGIASWAPLVPFVKSQAGLNDAQLGLVLLCLGIGSVIAMPLTGWLSARYGSKPMIILGGLGFGALFPFLVFSADGILVALILLGLGASLGTLDVSMNIHAVEVEKLAGKPIMSSFHALYSAGGIFGSGGVTFLLSQGYTPAFCAVTTGSVTLAAICVAWPRLLSARGTPVSFVVPHGVVVVLALLGATMFLVEGALLDWSALLLIEMNLSQTSQGGLGFVLFSIAMTIGRLTGDRVVTHFGNRNVLIYSGLITLFGFALLLMAPNLTQALAGFVFIGFGSANLVPVLFRLAGQQVLMPPALAIAAVTTVGYAGILLGPALIGFVSQMTNLVFAFVMLALLVAIVPFASGRAVQPR